MADTKVRLSAHWGKPLTIERARELISYDPTTGLFTWLVSRRGGKAKTGGPAGRPDEKGYLTITIDGKNYRAHRLVFFLETGEWPPEDVDHINRTPSDNRRINLRMATRGQNNCNRRVKSCTFSGLKGVHWRPERERWVAFISGNGQVHRLGSFKTAAEASAAYEAATKEMHGEFARVE